MMRHTVMLRLLSVDRLTRLYATAKFVLQLVKPLHCTLRFGLCSPFENPTDLATSYLATS